LGDALAVALMKKRDFKKEDFASFHPGGALGKRLFIKVDNILRRENLPIVSRGTSIKDAIIKISEGRIGNVIIIDENSKVFGILSDGDLRRALMNDDFDIEKSVDSIATRSPKTIKNTNLLAVEALEIIEEYKIQLLLVLGDDNSLVGVIHIHDLIEAGIKNEKL
jgi:arabinose-5-phosphate isomerase